MRKSWMGQNFNSKERLSPTSAHVQCSLATTLFCRIAEGRLRKESHLSLRFWSLFHKEVLNTTWQTEKIVWLLKMNSRMKYSNVNA